jgi:hypothetical protein
MYPLVSSTLDMFNVYDQVGLKCVHDGEGNFTLHRLIVVVYSTMLFQ